MRSLQAKLLRNVERIDPREWQWLERFRQPEKEVETSDPVVLHILGGACAMVLTSSIGLIVSRLVF